MLQWQNDEYYILMDLAGKAATEIKEGKIGECCAADIMNALRNIRDRIRDEGVCGTRGLSLLLYNTTDIQKASLEIIVSVEFNRYLNRAKEILAKNMEFVDAIAKALLEKKVLLNSDVTKEALMNSDGTKKLLMINILEILEKYTDVEHRLSQKDIEDILKNEYNMQIDRKSVKRNLMNLIDFGYEIEYSESIRIIKNKDGKEEEIAIFTDFYMNRKFADSELRLLIDSLLFSKHIPYSQCKELIEKLKGLSNIYFKTKAKHICNLSENMPTNKQLFYAIDVLDEAISRNRQVSFKYNEYGADKELHPRKNDEGKVREYIINPYQIVATNGKYYLICNYDKYERMSNYRLDRITDIRLLDTVAKHVREVKGAENGLNLPKHMAENIYMFAGESIRMTMRKWALQYALHVKVLSPENLVRDLKDDIRKAAENYEV